MGEEKRNESIYHAHVDVDVHDVHCIGHTYN
jgi:hypothetical protein